MSTTPKVYPRVGGGNDERMPKARRRYGLSPRGRGKLARFIVFSGGGFSIPAWAGETPAGRDAARRRRVYPRVGGGNLGESSMLSGCSGLSPRGRGKHKGLGSGVMLEDAAD